MKYFIAAAFCMCIKSALSQGVGEWTWMKGDSTYANDYDDLHSFGVKGVYSDTNIVPKLYGSACWSKGNRLYLLGGAYPYLLDYSALTMHAMWEYNVDSNKWCWLKGDRLNESNYVLDDYWGLQGVGDSITLPIYVENSATCIDHDGRFWLFSNADLNDLWKYDVTTNIWTWMKGPFGYLYHHYGIKGIADSLNNPPYSKFGEMWADKQGNLWLYGGVALSTYQWYQTVWRYNIATNVWTWMSGDTSDFAPPPVYDTLGVFNATNTPGGRENNSTHWVDSIGNFYVYGGFLYYPFGNADDLWKYDVTLNQWACIKAESSASYISYCTTVNLPSGRSAATGWVDRDGYFWLFGGNTVYTNPSFTNSSNDLWKYDPYHNEWWWESGDNYHLEPGVYGQQGVYSPTNVCRSRLGCASWVDSLNQFWVWGGSYHDFYPVLDDYNLNDLWRYIPDSTCGVYTGAQGPSSFGQNHFIITPNPASDHISIISAQSEVSAVRIYNAIGALILEDKVVPASRNINISRLPAGIYLVAVSNTQGTLLQKVVKQ